MKKLFPNPVAVIMAWLLLSVIFSIVVSFVLGVTTPGMEQEPFEFLAHMVKITVYSTLILAIITIPFYKAWVKEFWYISLSIIMIGVGFIVMEIKERLEEDGGSMSIESINVNGVTYERTTTYYDSSFKIIKSLSFKHDGKKDSLFTIYSKDGNIIKQERFKNGNLVEKLK